MEHNQLSLKAFFMEEHYRIPDYQREYSWGEPELSDFWNDLLEIYNDKNIDHFFGMIVLHNDETTSIKYIIDGQQRITTSVIFLGVVRDILGVLIEKEGMRSLDYEKSNIVSLYIGGEEDPYLLLGESDRDYFCQRIVRYGNPPGKSKESRESHERIRKAYHFIKNKILDTTSYMALDGKKSFVLDIYKSFIKRFNIIVFETSKLNEAYIIFETLNARGKDLAASDLLKNYILRTSNNHDRALRVWNEMSELLDGDLTAFIRYYWNSKNPPTTVKNLYRVVSEKVNALTCDDFLSELTDSYEVYYDLKTAGSNKRIDNAGLRKKLDILIAFGAKTFYPIIIALFRKGYSQQDIASVANAIVVYVFRNIIVYGMTANSTESFFSEIAFSISNRHPEVDSIIRDIAEKIIDDEVFYSAMKNLKFKKENDTIRYIIRSIHVYMSNNNQELNLNNDDVHIEHIMPQNIRLWQVDSEVHAKYLWKLGNLTLLAGPLNKAASNRPFAEKKSLYAQSAIEPTRMLLDYDEWGAEQIDDRQTKLAEMAVEIWKLPI